MQELTQDERWMHRALEAARAGTGRVHPNPLVGAVVVKNGRLISEGAHLRYGGPHAEVNALDAAGRAAAGATLYVTLEPCPHTGKTPPCADLILSRKIKKVVIGAGDPNPLVSGKGIRALRRGGVEVVSGVLSEAAEDLNKSFNFWMRRKMPYVIVKCAQSLDGRIATRTGKSRWISGEEARRFAHALRAESDAVLVGANTVRRDDPRLDARLSKNGATPIKVVLDAGLKTPLSAKLFSSKGPVILAATRRASAAAVRRFDGKAKVAVIKDSRGRVDLKALLKYLADRGVTQVLIEGGGEVIADAISNGLAQEICFIVAPLIIGGKNAVPSVGGEGAARLAKAWRLKEWRIEPLGADILFRGKF